MRTNPGRSIATSPGRWSTTAIEAARPLYTGRSADAWRMFGRQATIVAVALLVYFGGRALTEGSVDRAVANSWRLVDFERSIGLFHEEQFQAWVIDHGWMVTLANWVYIWGHWPVIAIVATWLVVRHPQTFVLYRNAFLISGAIGMVIFITFPVAPPRFISLDLVDTVTVHSNSYRVLQPPSVTNQYAAMPSLHFGWNLLIGIALVTTARSKLVRLFGIISPMAMAAAIVLTANHYIIDAVVGGTVALTGLYLAHHLDLLTWPWRDTPAEATRP